MIWLVLRFLTTIHFIETRKFCFTNRSSVLQNMAELLYNPDLPTGVTQNGGWPFAYSCNVVIKFMWRSFLVHQIWKGAKYAMDIICLLLLPLIFIFPADYIYIYIEKVEFQHYRFLKLLLAALQDFSHEKWHETKCSAEKNNIPRS